MSRRVELSGEVSRITFRNEQSGFTVCRLQPEGGGPLRTLVGTFPRIAVGEHLQVEGREVEHRDYGPQVAVEQFRIIHPTSLEGLERYLGSGLIRGVGPRVARKLVEAFGLETLDVLAQAPERLLGIEGIGRATMERIHQSVVENRERERVMLELRNRDIPVGQALRIYRQYGNAALSVLEENPYRLAEEVWGIGFRTADAIATRMGFDPNRPERREAALLFLLREAAAQGHVFLPPGELGEKTTDLLGLAATDLDIAELLGSLSRQGRLMREEEAAYLPVFYHAEKAVAYAVAELLQRPRQTMGDSFALPSRLSLAPEQEQAVAAALLEPFLIVTGGPGTGKTTILRRVLDLYDHFGVRYALAAPTGRAAKRLAEATGRPAQTLHRLLEYTVSPGAGATFGRNRERPLEAEVLVVDEASMVDLLLSYHLLQSLPPGGRLLLVGDQDQLPSVGAGNVLADLLSVPSVPRVALRHIFRQAEGSLIVENAHRINQGNFPRFIEEGDFRLRVANRGEEAREAVLAVVVRELAGAGLDPIQDVQVLSPMHRGEAGVQNLNLLLQEALNPPSPLRPQIAVRSGHLRLGDKVMQIRNNYQKGVYNGDVGLVVGVMPEDETVRVRYPDPEGDREVAYEAGDREELTLAYAASVHKAQGSEYPAVVLALLPEHFLLLRRNLVYTAVTRARKVVVVVGNERALNLALANNRQERRYSRLADRLRSAIHRDDPMFVQESE